MLRRSLLSLVLIASAFSSSGGQSLAQLPRATVATGMNDSTLVYVSDSAKRSRAAVAPDFRKMLSLRAFDSLVTASLRLPGTLNLTGGSITGSPSATLGAITVSSCTGCGGVSYPLLAPSGSQGAPTYSFSADANTGLYSSGDGRLAFSVDAGQRAELLSSQFNVSVPITSASSSAAAPSYSWTTSSGLGLYRFGADTMGFAAGGVASHRWSRQGIIKVAAGAGVQGCGTLALGIHPGAAGGTVANTGIVLDTTNAAGRIRFCDDGSTSMTMGGSAVNIVAGNGLRLANGSAAAPSLNFTNSTSTGLFRFGADTIGMATGGTNRVQLAATGFRSLVGLKTTTSSAGIADSGLVFSDNGIIIRGGMWCTTASLCTIRAATSPVLEANQGAGTITYGGSSSGFLSHSFNASNRQAATVADSQFKVVQGRVARPSFSFLNDSSSGIYRSAAQEITIATGATAVARFNASGQIMGTGSQGIGSPEFSFMNDGDTGIGRKNVDTLTFGTGGTARLYVANQGATGAGDVALCVTTGKVITQGATCGSSSAKVKTGFGSIFNPVEKTMALRPMAYSYIPGIYGGRHEFGLVADSTLAVDPSLVYRAEKDEVLPNGETIRKGDALNVNDRAVLALLIATVQQQQRSIDSLRLELSKVKKP